MKSKNHKRKLIKIILEFLILIILILGCKKTTIDNNYQFIPSSYLPVYPGSYWKYKIGNDTIISRTSDTLTFFMGNYYSILDGEIIRNYDKWLYYSVFYNGWFHILSDTVGLQFSHFLGDPRRHPESIHYTVLQKTKDEKGDSIIIQKYVINSGIPPYDPERQWVYQIYKKGVGLFFECGIDSVTKDTNYKKVLFNYFINQTWKPKILQLPTSRHPQCRRFSEFKHEPNLQMTSKLKRSYK